MATFTKNDIPFSVTAGGSAMPEHMRVAFDTTGFEGGNGSTHELTITWDAGEFEVEILQHPNSVVSGVRLQVHGDWELEGMMDALITLGEHLSIYRRKSGRSPEAYSNPFGEPA